MDRKDGVFVLVLVALAVVFFSNVLFTPLSFFMRDLMDVFHPYRVYVAENLKVGILPFWNPYNYAGVPFLANPEVSLFYPFSILFNLFSFPSAYKSFLVLHFFLAGLFCWLVMRSFGVNKLACFLCAIIFMFSGYITTRIEFIPILGVYIWLPLVLLQLSVIPEGQAYGAGSHRSSVTDYRLPITGYQSPVLLGVVLAMAFLAGHPQVVFYTGVFLLIWVLLKQDCEGLKKIFYGGVIGLLFIVIQLSGFIEFTLQSTRGTGLTFEEASSISLGAKDLLGFFLPSIAGPVSYYGLPGAWWLKCFYIGFIPLIFGIIGLFSRERKIIIPLLGSLLLIISLAMGRNSPVYAFSFKWLFPFRIICYPARMMGVCVFIMALFAGFGGQVISDRLSVISYQLPITGYRLPITIYCLLLAIVLGQLFHFGWGYNPVIHQSFFSASGENIKFLQLRSREGRFFLTEQAKQKSYAYAGWVEVKDKLPENINLPYHIFNVAGWDPLEVKSNRQLLEKLENIKVAGGLLDLFNVRWVLSPEDLGQGYELVKDGQLKIYENLDCLPRVFLTTNFLTGLTGFNNRISYPVNPV